MTAVPLAMLLMADGRMPVGGHTQSAGFEAAVMAGLGVGDVPSYLKARLASVATVDAGTAVLAHRSLSGVIADDLVEIWTQWAARTPSQTQRRAAEQAALGYLRLVDRLHPGQLPALRALARPP
ncbi:MAG: urease accessory protein UreF, partial [Micropruina sp.]